MFVISYCQIFAFYPNLNLDRIVIFQSFQQSADKIYHLNHFSKSRVKYFEHVTIKQLNHAATNVLKEEKLSALSEMFSSE